MTQSLFSHRGGVKLLYDVGGGVWSTSAHWPDEDAEAYDAAGLDELRKLGYLIVIQGLTEPERRVLRELGQAGYRVGVALLELGRRRYLHHRTIKRRSGQGAML